jgi:hypothetical protein
MIVQLIGIFAGLWQSRFVQAGLAAMVLPVTATTLHVTHLTNEVDADSLSGGLAMSSVWITLAAAALFGSLGGIVAELLSLHGHIELPHRVKPRKGGARRTRLADPAHEIDLGVVSRMMLGAAAGVALLALNTPGTATSLLVNSLIAGSAATAVFRLVQGRMLGKADSRSGKPALGVNQVQNQSGPAKVDGAVADAGERVEELAHPTAANHLDGALGQLGGNVAVPVRA